VLITATTVYTEDVLLALAKFGMLRKPYMIVVYSLIELCAIFLFGLSVYLVVASSSTPATIIICLPILTVLLFALPLRLVLLPKLTVRRTRESTGTVSIYRFTDYGVTVQSTSHTAVSQTSVDYAHFHNVYETEAFFFLFVNQLQAHVIMKSDMTYEDSSNLQLLLRMSVPPDRYHIRRS
jgi:hypothetical protein